MMTRSRYRTIFVLFLFLLVLAASGCASVAQRDPGEPLDPEQAFSPPPGYDDASSGQQQTGKMPQGGWWSLYRSHELDALMNKAFSDNPDINQTRARLAQASAQARGSAAGFFPSLTLTVVRGDTRGNNHTPSDFSLKGAAGYEMDLWGKTHAAYKADALGAEAGAEDVKAAAITLSASIAESWLSLLAAREEEILLREQIDLNKTVLDLQSKRYEMGAAQALDVLQQKEALAAAQARLPGLMAQQDVLEHQLAVLTGISPASPPQIAASKLPDPLPLPERGLPSSLLSERPDIVSAWLSLRAADWASEAAQRDRLPAFTLSATYTTAATALDGLFSAWLLDLAAQAAMPLIDGGARRAETLRREAVADERFHAYRAAVLTAVGEVEDALSLNYYQDKKLDALEEQLAATRNTLEQAQISYANGEQDYLNVLSALNALQALEQQIVEERLTLHLDRVALYRALGGQSWAATVASGAEETS